jgi:chromosome segregation ATPase
MSSREASSRAANISYQEVAAAIETLIVEGNTVTNINIRRVLARNYPLSEHRGSPNKVQEYMNQYFENNSYDALFRESHLSSELTGALVAEIKKHMGTLQTQIHHRLNSAESDREQFLQELTQMTDDRDNHLARIKAMEVSQASEIKAQEIEGGRLKERIERAEKDYLKVKADLDDANKLLEGKIGLLAVAEEKAKPAVDLKDRLDAAEQKNSDYFDVIQKLNRELLDALKEKTELKLKLLSHENSSNRQRTK